ncbi:MULTISPECIES: hypothetical protein [Haloarcula]|uniref:hypothetical protein n=1 Tax=Haloarcula TaxID=2237 RepID=UPI0023EDB9A2|nr:hypothetical protein [Halomicroarcula sp. XH51]
MEKDSDEMPALRDVWTEENPYQETEQDVFLEWENGAQAHVHITETLEYALTVRWPDGGVAGTEPLASETSSAFGALRTLNAVLAQDENRRLRDEYPAVHAVLTP